jgi:hypothetical protein
MRKIFRTAIAGSLLLASPLICGAQDELPTFQFLAEINIAGNGITPTDIAFHEGDLFVSCFASNRQIVRIANALTTNPQVSTFAVTASADGDHPAGTTPDGPIIWASGRGLTSLTVNPDNGNVLVAGDPGSGPHAVVEYDSAGNLIKVMEVDSPPSSFNRFNVARYFGDGVLVGSISGTNGLFHLNSTLDALAESTEVLGWPNFTRGITYVGDDIFIRTTSNGNDKIQRITGGTLGSLADYQWENLTFTELGPQTFNTSSAIQTFEYQGSTPATFIVANFSGTAEVPRSVNFYDPNVQIDNYPATPVLQFSDIEMGVGQLLALGFATTDDGQYMLLGRADTGTSSNAIQIYGIDGAQLAEAPVGELGDVNNDGVINVADVTELGNLVAAGTPPENTVGDVNGDETVNEADVQALADLIANP